MRTRVILAGLFLLAGSALAQDTAFPKVETSPAFMFIRTPTSFTAPSGTSFNESFNCAGGGGTIAYNLSSVFGVAADLGGCKYFGETIPVLSSKVSGSDFTYMFGPRFTFRNASAFRPFFEVNFGGNRLSLSCNSGTPCSGLTYSKNAFAMTAGGGFDIRLSKRFSLRPIQAEYLYTRFGNSCQSALCSDNNNQNSFRLKSGIVMGWGGAALTPAANCSVQPAEVTRGEPIIATVSASNFNPKHTVTYAWSGNGGQITGTNATAQIDTTKAAPRSYTVSARVTDTNEKKNNEATCWANFTVKPLPRRNPPTMSISARPRTLQAGGAVNLAAKCISPDGVSVSVASWTASSGSVSGSGTAATLNTAGVRTGSITVGTACTDSRGLTTASSTTVTVHAPLPPAELEVRLALHSIYFPTAQPTAQNPDGGVLASQQQMLTVLASDFLKYLESKPDAHLILEGHADVRGSAAYNQALSERRVEGTKHFLIERGVPQDALETKAMGDQHNLTPDEVKALVESNTELTPEERERILKNMKSIIWASNRRVDITLSTTGQESVRHYPFNAADSLSLIGGREVVKKKK
jgi:outer membrane protein OmpA-like peptidoglycan-associated protein